MKSMNEFFEKIYKIEDEYGSGLINDVECIIKIHNLTIEELHRKKELLQKEKKRIDCLESLINDLNSI